MPIPNPTAVNSGESKSGKNAKPKPSELARLSAADRDKLYSDAAYFAAHHYAAATELTAFNALDAEPFADNE